MFIVRVTSGSVPIEMLLSARNRIIINVSVSNTLPKLIPLCNHYLTMNNLMVLFQLYCGARFGMFIQLHCLSD